MTVSALAQQLREIQQKDRIIRGAPAGQTKRPSFLFDEREAAGYDNEAILQLGEEGFHSLCELDPTLRVFEDRIFNPRLLRTDLSTLTGKERKEVNEEVDEFLILLSPHFQEKSCHKVMEWLVRKWRVNEVNVDALMICILPHHDSLPFVRMIQIIYFTTESRWSFLFDKVKQSGSPVHRTLLAQRCIVDSTILGRVLHGMTVIKQHLEKYPLYPFASMYIAFLTHLMLEYVQRAEKFTDVDGIRTFQRLELLIKSPELPQMMVGAMMIFMHLCDRIQLSAPAIQYMIRKFIQGRSEDDEIPALLTAVQAVQVGHLDVIEDSILMEVAQLTKIHWKSLQAYNPTVFLDLLLETLEKSNHSDAHNVADHIKSLLQ